MRFLSHGTFTPDELVGVHAALQDIRPAGGMGQREIAVEIRPVPGSRQSPIVTIRSKQMLVSRPGIRLDELRRRLADAGLECTDVPLAVAQIRRIAFLGRAWASCPHPPRDSTRMLLDRALTAQRALSDGPEPEAWRWTTVVRGWD